MGIPPIETRSQLVAYELDEGEGVLEGLTAAFSAIDVDVYDLDTTVEDWVGKCGITEIDWDTEDSCRVTTVIWDHPTVVTGDEIRIYD